MVFFSQQILILFSKVHLHTCIFNVCRYLMKYEFSMSFPLFLSQCLFPLKCEIAKLMVRLCHLGRSCSRSSVIVYLHYLRPSMSLGRYLLRARDSLPFSKYILRRKSILGTYIIYYHLLMGSFSKHTAYWYLRFWISTTQGHLV